MIGTREKQFPPNGGKQIQLPGPSSRGGDERPPSGNGTDRAAQLYVTVAEAAVLLRVCTKTVRSRIKVCELEAYQHGRRILIPLGAIERLIKSGRIDGR